MLCGIQASVTMVLQKSKKVIAPDEVELARLQRLAGEFVRSAGNSRVQTQDFSRLSNSKNESFSFARGG